jgi:protein-tyrosine phosphatase
MQTMGIDWPSQLQLYRSAGIDTVVHFPCSNVDPKYEDKVFTACKHLHDLISSKQRRVFIHCSSGLVRSPTVVLAYMCIFKRVKNWRNVDQTRDYIT